VSWIPRRGARPALRHGTVAVLEALGIALERKKRANTVLLGAVACTCPFVDPEAVKEAIREKLSAATRPWPRRTSFDRGLIRYCVKLPALCAENLTQ